MSACSNNSSGWVLRIVESLSPETLFAGMLEGRTKSFIEGEILAIEIASDIAFSADEGSTKYE